MAGQGILAGANGLNFGAVLGMLVPRAEAIVVFSVISYITIEILDAVLSGHVSMAEFLRELQLAIDLNKTVREFIKGKKASIKNAPLDPGGPSWDELLPLTLETVRRLAQQNKTGYKTIWKLLTSHRFDK